MNDIATTRDFAVTTAVLGTAAFMWFGWSLEDPPPRWRWALAVGSGFGLLLAVLGGV